MTIDREAYDRLVNLMKEARHDLAVMKDAAEDLKNYAALLDLALVRTRNLMTDPIVLQQPRDDVT